VAARWESAVANQVDRRDMERWLVQHGFVRLPGKKTGHVFYERDGVKITLPGHGPQDLTKKHVAMILRQLEGAGFEKEQIRRELDA
jgi:predicted RNA binding protein YcfA (HicA-like mRNA interferase family)